MQYPLVPLWVQQNLLGSGLLLALAVGIGASYARGQAVVEYGHAVSGASAVAGAASSALKGAMPSATTPAAATLAAHLGEPVEVTNRKALEAQAGKNAAKLMLRSVPSQAWVRIDKKIVGKTPLLLIVAPGVYSVDMEGARKEFGHQQIDLLPKESKEVVLTLEARYPARVPLQWSASPPPPQAPQSQQSPQSPQSQQSQSPQ